MRSWSTPEPLRLFGSPPPLRLYDTAARAVREQRTPAGRMYVCGITPYDATHLGHAFTYLTFDLVNRVWRDSGLDVHYVQNVTDVDDPLLERALATGQDWQALAEGQTELFRTDMAALRVLPPRDYVGAVESIPLVADVVQRLRADGLAYQVDDDWYFPVRAVAEFGEVSHLDPEQMVALFAERGGDPTRPGKKDPLDCLLWQSARPDEPAWETSLGHGRPGWHVECTAIALDRHGQTLDLQGGGRDLVFPHHEMCAAQARALTGQPLADVFAHAGMVGLDGHKMSKSRGNLVLVSQLRAEGVDPRAVRLALLAHHYRADFDWTAGDLTRATTRLDAWQAAVAADAGPDHRPVLAAVRAALANDLDAPGALAAVDAWADAVVAGGGQDPEAPGRVAVLVDTLLGVALREGTAAPRAAR